MQPPLRQIVVALLVITGTATAAVGAGPEIESVQVGIQGSYNESDPALVQGTTQGHFKIGQWTPVFVELATATPNAKLIIDSVDPDGNPTTFQTGQQIDDTHLYAEFRAGRIESEIRIRVVSESGETTEHRIVPSESAALGFELTHYFVGVIGKSAGFSVLDPRNEDKQQLRETMDHLPPIRVIEIEDARNLPLQVHGWDSLDAIVMADDYDLPAEQNEAMRQWVNNGGHLIVAAGNNSDRLVQSSVYKWMSSAISVDEAPQRIFELTGLESFAGRTNRIPRSRSNRINAAQVKKQSGGTILVNGRDGPLLLKVPFGFGQITFLAIDLNRAPLQKWKSLPLVCFRMLFSHLALRSDEERSQSSRLSRSGISDLATQLNSSQQSFGDVKRYSTWSVMGLVALYLLVIGPLDYLLVHRILRRPGLTWITFPVLAVAGSLLAINYADVSNGDQLQVRQLELLDLNVSSGNGLVRSQSTFTVYGPEARRYSVTAAPKWPAAASASQSTRVSWAGIPENTFGGMYRPPGLALAAFPYSIVGENSCIENLPIQQWSTQQLETSWQSSSTIPVQAQLKSSSIGLLNGFVEHNLPFEISDWLLAYENRVYRPAADGKFQIFKPGAKWFPGNRRVQKRDLKSFLKGVQSKRVKRDQDNDTKIVTQQRDYDPLNTDSDYIVRILTFHEQTGADQYTGLNNGPLRRMDFTRTVSLKRAILFGRISKPATDLMLDDSIAEPQNYDGFVRIVLPVEVADSKGVFGELPEYNSDGISPRKFSPANIEKLKK